MTFLRRQAIREMEAEIGLFWSAMSDMKAMQRACISARDPAMQDVVAEIEAIECNTDWPRLKRACATALAVFAPVEAMAHCLAAVL